MLTRINQMSTSNDIYINDIVLFVQARSGEEVGEALRTVVICHKHARRPSS